MIEDEEFRGLFRAESDEHLQLLDDSLLALEKSPADTSRLAEAFRAAHSIKGAARMMNLPELEQVSHELESVLGKAKKGELVLTSEIIDRLCSGVDAMRALCFEAVTGESVGVELESVLQQLVGEVSAEDVVGSNTLRTPRQEEMTTEDGDSQEESITPPGREAAEANETPAIDPIAEKPESTSADEAQQGQDASQISQRSESVRVATEKLDQLMSQASELVVVRNRYAHRLSELEQLTSCWSGGKKQLDLLKKKDDRQSTDADNVEASLDHFQEVYQELGVFLKNAVSGAREDSARLGLLTQGLEAEIRSLRMLPLKNVFAVFPRLVRDIARSQDKQVHFVIDGAETCADKTILEEIKDPLSHMIRNALDHGIESTEERRQAGKEEAASLQLRAYQTSSAVIIELEDDGRGLNTQKILAKALKQALITEEEASMMTEQQIHGLIFAAGFSTADLVTDLSGRGVGMDVVRTNVEKLKGTIEIESTRGRGSCFRLSFPLTLATTRALIFKLDCARYALPVDVIERAVLVSEDSFLAVGGVNAISLGSEVIPVLRLADLLPLARSEHSNSQPSQSKSTEFPCIIIEQHSEKVGLLVDELLTEQEIVLKPHGHVLGRVRNVACSTILETGDICMVLNGTDILRTVTKRSTKVARSISSDNEKNSKRILLAEDSLTTRIQEKRILEAAGYEVVAAVDGAEALEKLSSEEFDLVVSDVEMPRLDGLSLTKKIREQERYAELPIILVTSLSTDEDKRRGSDAGANAYITKGSFDHQLLLETIARFI